jgi:hypothetical protein
MNKPVQWLAITVAVMFFGCSGTDQGQKLSSDLAPELDGAPPWVLLGCANFEGEPAPICGVGSASGVSSLNVGRAMAIGRARTDLAWYLSRKLKLFEKCYPTSTGGGEYFFSAGPYEPQVIVDRVKWIVSTALSSVEVAAEWTSQTGTLWVLVKLDPETVSDIVLGTGPWPDERVLDDLLDGIRRAFKKLDVSADFAM